MQDILVGLKQVKEGLEEEGFESTWLLTLGELTSHLGEHVTRQRIAGDAPSLGNRLGAIETALKALTTPKKATAPTWANVTANGVRQAYGPPATAPTRHTVRVTMPKAKGLGSDEILREVKKTISGAAAIRVLRSGDIDVTVPDEASKDRAQGIPSTEEIQVHRRDYLLEVLGVPLKLQVAGEKHADNQLLAQSICDASRGLSPGLQITRVKWLYNGAQLERMREAGKQRGTLLVGVPTEAMRRAAVRGGLVINAELFEARLFAQGMVEARCFNCQQWGHMQRACVKLARCGECAGPHQTRECPRERVSCANCGKDHKAWQGRQCGAFIRYRYDLDRKRVALLSQTMSIRGAPPTQPEPQADGWTTMRKRQRQPSPGQSDQRRIGRPTLIEQAGRDITQTRLWSASSSQGSSMRNSVVPATQLANGA